VWKADFSENNFQRILYLPQKCHLDIYIAYSGTPLAPPPTGQHSIGRVSDQIGMESYSRHRGKEQAYSMLRCTSNSISIELGSSWWNYRRQQWKAWNEGCGCISNMFGKLKNGFFTELWDCVLYRFDAAAKLQQSASESLNTVVKTLLPPQEFLLDLRGQFDNFEEWGKRKNC